MTPLPDTDAPQELRPLVQTVHKLLERVQETIRRERRFTDDAAHELRTPLTAIKTNVQVARLAMSKGGSKDIIDNALLSADRGVIRLQNTLDQLLTLARLDGSADPAIDIDTQVDFAVCQAINDVQDINNGSQRLVYDAQKTNLNADLPELLLVCALRNLLDNALRYSPQDCLVTLHISRIKQNRIRFVVQDEGNGLTEEERANAVHQFWRRDSDPNGSGLGLAIVNAIATRYNGELHLLNREPKGLEVRLDLPERLSD